MTITITPLELIQYAGYILGVLGIIMWIRIPVGGKCEQTAGILGALFLAAGVAAHCAKYEKRGQIAHKVAFVEVPPEWQTFYENLNKLTDRKLQKEAVRRFAKLNPPQLTIDNYDALCGTKLWEFSNRTNAQRILRHSESVREMIIFDFEEGKP